MQTARKTLLATAAAIATNQLTHLVSDWDVDRLLSPLGLARRRSAWPKNLAFLGAGVVVGGVAALLLAPASGVETRAKFTKKVGEFGAEASKQVRELGEQVRHEVEVLRHHENSTNNQPGAQTLG